LTIELKRLFPLIAYIRYWLIQEDLYAIQSPSVFRLYQNLLRHRATGLKTKNKVDQQHEALLQDRSILEIEDYGAGSIHLPQKRRMTAEVTRYSTSSKKYSLLYEYFCSLTPAANVIELGTCTGINVQYLAQATLGKVYTIEGSKALQEKASSYNENHKIVYLKGKIQELLPPLLAKVGQVDFVLIDASHTYRDTIDFFETLLPFLHSKSIVAIGDIYWSQGMETAWKELCKHEHVRLSLDFFECGLLLFDAEYPKDSYILTY
jgi:predicted O-methyltransferase YrrM